jgi:hypothetical protein
MNVCYNYDFLRHTHNHIVSKDELRLREVVLQNFKKSLFMWNLLAAYLNYRRKNKNFIRSFVSTFY